MDPAATLASLTCLALPAVTLCYAAACAVKPFTPCPRCHTTGVRRAAFGRTRWCGHCKTTGWIPRRGVRAYNHARRHNRHLGGPR